MNRLIQLGMTIVLAFSLMACSPKVNIQVQKAPEIDLHGAKNIRIEAFNTNGNLNLDLIGRQRGGMSILGAVAEAGVNRLLVTDEKNRSLSLYQRNQLTQELFRTNYFNINENNGDATIRGAIHYEVNDTKSGRDIYYKDGSKGWIAQMTRKADVDIQVEVLDNRGTVIGVSNVRTSASSSVEGPDHDRCRDNLDPWDRLVLNALDKSAWPIRRLIAPYNITEVRYLAKGDVKSIGKGNDAAEDGNWNEAENDWNEALGATKVSDQAAAKHNLAVRAEVAGRLEDALRLLQEARALHDDSDWAAEENHLRNRIAEDEQLRRANEERLRKSRVNQGDQRSSPSTNNSTIKSINSAPISR